MSKYTKEQEVIVEKILSSKADYYRILSVEKTSLETDIKKAYRKLALKIHPDKNSHPNAPEAFKAASKAFEVLSDSSKKRIYDQTGQDPDLRSAAAAAAASSSGFGGAGRHPGFPFATAGQPGTAHFDFNDDIFNMFFGGAGPGTTFTFGPGGSFQTFGGPAFQQSRRRTRRTPGAASASASGSAGNEDLLSNLSQILPIIIIVLFSILTSFFTGDESANKPQYSFKKEGPYKYERTTPNYNVNYFITEDKFEHSKVKDLKNLDHRVETKYIQNLNFMCTVERKKKEDLIHDAYGFFFIDHEQLERGQNYPTPSCDKLESHGLLWLHTKQKKGTNKKIFF